MNNPKISVIIPVYNTEKYLDECINSILYQTLKTIEIIFVDNNSSDNSVKQIEKYMQLDKRVKLVKLNSNYGAGEARNVALRLARGEFVSFMDSDDCYYSNSVLETFYNKAIKKSVDICGGNILYKNTTTNETAPCKRVFFEQEKYIKLEDYVEFGGYFRFIYRLDIIKKYNIFFPDYFRRQDPVWFYQIMSKVEDIYVVPSYFYVYRVSHKVVKWNDRQVLDSLKSYLDNFKLLKALDLPKHYLLEINNFKKTRLHDIGAVSNKEILNKIENVFDAISFDFVVPVLEEQVLTSDEQKELDLIIKNIEQDKAIKPITIVGFGKLGQVLYGYLTKNNYKVEFIFDKSFKGLTVNSINIISSEDLFSFSAYNDYKIINTILNIGFKNMLYSSHLKISLV